MINFIKDQDKFYVTINTDKKTVSKTENVLEVIFSKWNLLPTKVKLSVENEIMIFYSLPKDEKLIIAIDHFEIAWVSSSNDRKEIISSGADEQSLGEFLSGVFS